jgi:CRP-like cAMP-binding protein
MEEEKLLKAIPMLQDLDEEELRQVLKIARRVQFPRGKEILKEGETGETMYIIEEGMVEISKTLGYEAGRGRLPGSR